MKVCKLALHYKAIKYEKLQLIDINKVSAILRREVICKALCFYHCVNDVIILFITPINFVLEDPH